MPSLSFHYTFIMHSLSLYHRFVIPLISLHFLFIILSLSLRCPLLSHHQFVMASLSLRYQFIIDSLLLIISSYNIRHPFIIRTLSLYSFKWRFIIPTLSLNYHFIIPCSSFHYPSVLLHGPIEINLWDLVQVVELARLWSTMSIPPFKKMVFRKPRTSENKCECAPSWRNHVCLLVTRWVFSSSKGSSSCSKCRYNAPVSFSHTLKGPNCSSPNTYRKMAFVICNMT